MTNDLVLIRHAETSLAGAFCGHSDPPINAAGEAQSQTLCASLQQESFDAIYSSDLQRAFTTAQILAANRSIQPIPSAALREINFGAWEALRWTEIEQRDPATAAQWIAEFPHRAAPHGETYASFEHRVLAKIHCLTTTGPQRIAILTHAGVLRVVLQTILGMSAEQAWRWPLPFCSVLRLSRSSANTRWRLL